MAALLKATMVFAPCALQAEYTLMVNAMLQAAGLKIKLDYVRGVHLAMSSSKIIYVLGKLMAARSMDNLAHVLFVNSA